MQEKKYPPKNNIEGEIFISETFCGHFFNPTNLLRHMPISKGKKMNDEFQIKV